MKTSEFIKFFEDEGYIVYKGDVIISVDDKSRNELFDISEKNSVATDYIAFDNLPFSKQQEYYKVIFEYLMTPPEEREEEKRYYLKISFSSEEETYLCAYDFWSDWILIEKDSFTHGDEFYFKFTQKQIDEMPECYKHPAVWEQIEVTDND